jgi:hypothetical protein
MPLHAARSMRMTAWASLNRTNGRSSGVCASERLAHKRSQHAQWLMRTRRSSWGFTSRCDLSSAARVVSYGSSGGQVSSGRTYTRVCRRLTARGWWRPAGAAGTRLNGCFYYLVGPPESDIACIESAGAEAERDEYEPRGIFLGSRFVNNYFVPF